MRRVVLAAAVFGVLSIASQTEASPARRATVSDNAVQPRRELVATSDRVTTRNSNRKERAVPPEQLIPDICRGC